MKITQFVFAGLAIAICLPSFASDQQAKDQIQAGYAKLQKAFMNKDVSYMMSLAAPGFREKHGKTTLTAQQAAAQMKTQFGMVQKVTGVTINVKSLKVNGNTAIATTSMKFSADIAVGDNKVHKLVSTGTSKDTWVKTSSGWKVKETIDIGEKATLDGKPVQTGMNG